MLISGDDVKNSLEKNIKKARKNLGYTQEHVAENCGISIDLLRSIENGRNAGSITTLLNLCNFLEISPNTLFGDLLTFNEKTLDTTLSSYFGDFSQKDKELFKKIIIHLDKNY